MTNNITADDTLDCSGLSCPMPLLKTKKKIGSMKSGQVLEIISTDPGTQNDLPAFARKTGNELLDVKVEDGRSLYYLKIK
ncbi:MAG: preprotein translocase subunit TatC [Desulfobacteraceae bacterium 4572_87]|nr:MAG: preprotein translocase subunit TatC [Desulfobacteraceae bacterium 4572_87]